MRLDPETELSSDEFPWRSVFGHNGVSHAEKSRGLARCQRNGLVILGHFMNQKYGCTGLRPSFRCASASPDLHSSVAYKRKTTIVVDRTNDGESMTTDKMRRRGSTSQGPTPGIAVPGFIRNGDHHFFTEFINEVADEIGKLAGEPDALDKCREAYQSYVDEPTVQRRDLLQIANEAIPMHHRRYVGDMDTRSFGSHATLLGGPLERNRRC
jgi:hypothetical protein